MAKQQVTLFFGHLFYLTTLTLRFWKQHIPNNICMEANPKKVKPTTEPQGEIQSHEILCLRWGALSFQNFYEK